MFSTRHVYIHVVSAQDTLKGTRLKMLVSESSPFSPLYSCIWPTSYLKKQPSIYFFMEWGRIQSQLVNNLVHYIFGTLFSTHPPPSLCYSATATLDLAVGVMLLSLCFIWPLSQRAYFAIPNFTVCICSNTLWHPNKKKRKKETQRRFDKGLGSMCRFTYSCAICVTCSPRCRCLRLPLVKAVNAVITNWMITFHAVEDEHFVP